MMKFRYDENSTPVNSDEICNLIPSHIQTQSELNLWEQNNIANAERKLFASKKPLNITSDFIKKVHKSMFCNTWKWAGKFRTVNTNIGIDRIKISVEIQLLCDDLAFWFGNNSYPLAETAVRFSHRLVCIHPFTNGNGRCSRLLADLIMVRKGFQRFSWGSKNLTEISEVRSKYIQALRAADNFDIESLLDFAAS
ncbi:MAG: mobile mystery protein B [Dysgonamonadaceae bacterium]|jgi:Fic-DOC domain mobile mystery protein B|nr:mobile mystery protein B [Dysgonamonadaceae bacterium]